MRHISTSWPIVGRKARRTSLFLLSATIGLNSAANAQSISSVHPATPSAQQPFTIQMNDALLAAPASKKEQEKPFTLLPTLQLSYDDNIYRRDPPAETFGSFIVSPGAQARFSKNIGIHQVTLDATGQYNFYTSHDDRSYGRYVVHGGADFHAGRCVLSPDASFRSERTDYGDVSAAINNVQRTTLLGVTVECPRPAGLYPSVQYQHRIGRNSDGFLYADETTDTAQAGLVFAKPSFGELMPYYAYQHSDRPGLGFTNRSDQFGLRFKRAISSLFAAKLDLSYLNARSSLDGIKPYKGAGWDFQLSSRIIPLTTVSLDFTRQITNDALVAAVFTVQTGYNGQVRVDINNLTAIKLFGDYKTRDFRRSPTIVQSTLKSDDFLYFGGELNRQIGQRLVAKANITRFVRKTEDNSNNYSANQYLVGIEAHF